MDWCANAIPVKTFDRVSRKKSWQTVRSMWVLYTSLGSIDKISVRQPKSKDESNVYTYV